jgi:hypothetical protein
MIEDRELSTVASRSAGQLIAETLKLGHAVKH